MALIPGDEIQNEPGPVRSPGHQALQHWALFLDVDGTLLPIVARPGDVKVPGPLLTLLGDLHDCLGGALALVSGRAIADLDRLFSPLKLPCAGVHGLERRNTGDRLLTAAAASELEPLRTRLAAYVSAVPGLLLEDKGRSLAVHYRQAPGEGSALEDFLARVLADCDASIELTHGKMVFEVKPRGFDKGTAIQAFMSEAPFRGRRPAFLGDDVTDEDGFAVVNDLGGLSIKVGAGSFTAAKENLADEAAVEVWLRGLVTNKAPA